MELYQTAVTNRLVLCRNEVFIVTALVLINFFIFTIQSEPVHLLYSDADECSVNLISYG